MLFRNVALMVLSGTILSGCLESEKSCYERLKSDFKSSFEFGLGGSCTSAACLDYARIANESRARIFMIYTDDDQSACDYISDGPRLRRK